MGLHLCPIEPSLDPDDCEDPLERVEFPRERKPWKRDRHVVRSKAQGAINAREALTVRDFGRGWQYATSVAAQSREANHAQLQVWRALKKIDDPRRMHFEARHEFYLRLHRLVRHVRRLRLAAAGWEAGVIPPGFRERWAS
jgi:hypothetical protein